MDFSKKDYNAQITEIEVQIPSITGLATTVVLNAIENKIPKACNLVKKNRLWWKNMQINLRVKYLMQKIKERRFVDKSVITGFIDNSDSDKKIRR